MAEVIIKQDINFLEYPNWVLDSKTKLQKLVIEKPNGKYEVLSPCGLPTHFDKLILYCILLKLWRNTQFESLEITTTRYEIAKNVFEFKATTPYQFDRILKSLKKWKTVSINFEGIFYEGNNHTIRYFSIIDDVILDTKTKQIYIRFNQQYIKQLKETKFYKLINFEELKRLSKTTSVRLYEILVKNFKERPTWHISIHNLAEKLTIDKRSNAKDYYPSDVLINLKPAITEINKKTELKIDFSYNKESNLCIFRNATKTDTIAVPETDNKDARIAIQPTLNPLLEILIAYSIPVKRAQALIDQYPAEKIKHKIELLKQTDKAIKNVGAWLTKALEEDWGNQEYNKQLEEQARIQKAKEEALRKQQEQEELNKKIELMQKEYAEYKRTKAYEIFNASPTPVQAYINEQFRLWFKRYGNANTEEVDKASFLASKLLSKAEQDFEQWASSKGHNIKRIGKVYKCEQIRP